jgi:hypothetical protein
MRLHLVCRQRGREPEFCEGVFCWEIRASVDATNTRGRVNCPVGLGESKLRNGKSLGDAELK